MNVQFIRSPGGEEMAVLPRKEYETLVERVQDLRDIRKAKATMARIHKGEEELIPGDLIARLVKGENPVRVWREHRDLTGDQLAKAAGLSRTYITQIETGRRKGTVDVLKDISKALGIQLDDIVSWNK